MEVLASQLSCGLAGVPCIMHSRLRDTRSELPPGACEGCPMILLDRSVQGPTAPRDCISSNADPIVPPIAI
eukprot:3197360-Rhodomonas_salina.1